MTPIQTNFTAGELSPRVHSRIDIAKYNNGLKTCENVELLVHGGARRRPGLRFVAEVKDSTKAVRLIEFIFNREQAYMLELGDYYMRVFKNGAPVLSGGTPYEIATPYSALMLPDVAYVQGADTMFLVHPEVPVYRLQRFGDASWRMLQAVFTVEPFDELGHTLGAALTLSAATVGTGRTFTSTGQFLASDVGRDIVSGAGLATVTAYVDANSVTAQIKTEFSSTSIASGAWTLTISPQGAVKPSAFEVVGTAITLDSDSVPTAETAKAIASLSVSGLTVTCGIVAHGYSNGQTIRISGCIPSQLNGLFVISGVSTNSFQYTTLFTIDPDEGSALGTASRISMVVGPPLWRAVDVGKYVKLNGGVVRITGVTSSTSATGVIAQPMTSAVAAIANSWTLNASVWNAVDKYPRAVTLYEQRLQLAGSPGYPQTVWGSRIGDVLNFEPGTSDDDAYGYEVSTSLIAPIQHLSNAARLMVLTNFNEMSLRGGVEKPITPTSLQKKDESTAGSSRVRPVKVGNELLFVQRAGRKVRSLGYRYDIDGFDSPDRTLFSEHITGTGVVDMAFQQEPDAMLMCVREDGQLAVCTYDVAQDVIAWSRWITDGTFESVASIPTSDSEQMWCVVRRNVGGVAKRYIEVFDPTLNTDSARFASTESESSSLDHLEGKVVQALADDVYQGEFTVTGGSVTLPRAADTTEIGLGYTSLMEMLNPEVGSQAGTSQGAAISVGEVIVRVLDTASVVINGQTKTFRKMNDALLDRPPEVGTGDMREVTLSDQLYRNNLTITQPLPVAFHVLAIIRKCTVND